MLKSLDYSVTFPSTGRTFQNRIDFAPGLTAITGRNEAGKTINLEMIGYCLFGKEALRGAAGDYKSLVANLNLDLGGKDVLIERARKETLTVDGEVKAVGAEAINKEIPKMLGFGLDVFNIACAAQQGDLDALTNMKPTARRQMIDRLIGIDLLEAIEKDCKQEAKTAETVAASLAMSMVAPQEPVRPDDYEESVVLEELLDDAKQHEFIRQTLMAVTEPVAPVAPTPPAEIDVAMLEAHEANRQAQLQAQARLEGKLAGMPEPKFSRGDLEKAVAYQGYQAEVARRGAKPDVEISLLRDMDQALDVQQRAGEEVECPKCDHHFHLGVSQQDEAWLGFLVPLTRAQITTQFRRHELWAEPLPEVAPFEIPNIQQEILAHANADDRAAVLDELGWICIPADRSGELRASRVYQQELAVFAERDARYSSDLATFRDAHSRLAGMADRSGEVVDCTRRLGDARSFESHLERFEREQGIYDALVGRVQEQRDLADGYGRGATALKRSRVRVKQELAPSLARAASTLLVAMTNGERRFIDVDEDFNILVDGQPIQTLSGSGKSVVNLALRLGLGQVLTSKVLPIFLGDEIDADCDDHRAKGIAGALQNLRQYLGQIILVTHKEIEADQTINLDTVSA